MWSLAVASLAWEERQVPPGLLPHWNPQLFTVLFPLLGLDLCPFWEVHPDSPETKPGTCVGLLQPSSLPITALLSGCDLTVYLSTPRDCHLGGRDRPGWAQGQCGMWSCFINVYWMHPWLPRHTLQENFWARAELLCSQQG